VVIEISRPLREIIESLTSGEVDADSLDAQSVPELINDRLAETIERLELLCRWIHCLGFPVDMVSLLESMRLELGATTLSSKHASRSPSSLAHQSTQKILEDLNRIQALCSSSLTCAKADDSSVMAPKEREEGKKPAALRQELNPRESIGKAKKEPVTSADTPTPTPPLPLPLQKKKNNRKSKI
jgi:hypothetical protein